MSNRTGSGEACQPPSPPTAGAGPEAAPPAATAQLAAPPAIGKGAQRRPLSIRELRAQKYRGDAPDPSEPRGPQGRGAGYTVLSYLIAGLLAYGAIGWLVSRAVHIAVLFPVGMLAGLAISLALVIYRYGRSS
jgi:F0F1-type ATP synthase assembly protein I